jgi:hypothetical protein
MKTILAAIAALLVTGCTSTDHLLALEVHGPRLGATVHVYEGAAEIASATGMYGFVDSNSPGAVVSLNPSRDHELEIRVEGFEPEKLRLTSHVVGSQVALLVTYCCIFPVGAPIFIPLAISSNSYLYRLEPSTAVVTLRPIARSDGPPAPPTNQPSTPEVSAQPAAVRAPPPPSKVEPVAASKPAFCSSCGAKFQGEDQRFCPSCGAKR